MRKCLAMGGAWFVAFAALGWPLVPAFAIGDKFGFKPEYSALIGTAFVLAAFFGLAFVVNWAEERGIVPSYKSLFGTQDREYVNPFFMVAACFGGAYLAVKIGIMLWDAIIH